MQLWASKEMHLQPVRNLASSNKGISWAELMKGQMKHINVILAKAVVKMDKVITIGGDNGLLCAFYIKF